jgi:hypothetical protein
MPTLSSPSGVTLSSPGTLRQALADNVGNVKAQRREYWWPGHVHYQAGINSGAIGQAFNVTGATNVNPIKVTTDKAHGLTTGDAVTIKGVMGNTAANVSGVTVHVVDTTSFTLDATAGNGAYTDGGTVQTPKTNGESADIFNISGAGIVTNLTLILGSALTQNDCQLWIYVDGESTASLKIPMCQLLGLSNGVSWNTGASAFDQSAKLRGNGHWATQNIDVSHLAYDDWNEAAGSSCRASLQYPVPFTNGCRATLFQCGSSDNTSTNTWAITSYTSDVQSPLRLKCQTTPTLLSDGTTPYTQSSTAGGADLTLMSLAAGQAGYIVGHGLSFDSWNSDSTAPTPLERNLYIFRDQEAVASYQSSGTEDFFNSCFYFRNLSNAQLDGVNLYYWGPGSTGNSRYAATIALCSVFKDILQTDQSIKFTDGVTLKWMYGPDGAARVGSNANVRSWTLYYQ